MFYNQARRFGISEKFSTRSELVDVPGKFRITCGTCDAPRQVARTPAREELQAGPGAGEASDGKRHEGITHRIHGAGIYANIKGVYRWDPCYHIYNIAYSIHDL